MFCAAVCGHGGGEIDARVYCHVAKAEGFRVVKGFTHPRPLSLIPLQRHPISCTSRASINHRVSRNSIVAFSQTRALGCCWHRDSRSSFVQKCPAWVWLRLSVCPDLDICPICRFIFIFIWLCGWLSVPVFCSLIWTSAPFLSVF